MKKYNRVSYKWFWGIALPILIFFASMNVAYAYFTASTYSDTEITTGIIAINLSNMNYSSPETLTFTTKMTDIEPGDLISVDGRISNVGNISLYYVLEYTINVKDKAETQSIDYIHKYCTVSNDTTVSEISSNTQDAKLLGNTYDTYNDFTISHYVPASLNSDFEGGTITITINVHAIQAATITSANAALKLLLPSL